MKLSGDLNSDFGFTGFYQEQTVNLDLTWFRVYDPDKGRWLSRDPSGDFTGPNLFEYCSNNPGLLRDPYGLQSDTGDSFQDFADSLAEEGKKQQLAADENYLNQLYQENLSEILDLEAEIKDETSGEYCPTQQQELTLEQQQAILAALYADQAKINEDLEVVEGELEALQLADFLHNLQNPLNYLRDHI